MLEKGGVMAARLSGTFTSISLLILIISVTSSAALKPIDISVTGKLLPDNESAVEPVSTDPVLPPPIGDIVAWTMPGVQKDTSVRISNNFTEDLIIESIEVVELNGPAGWLDVGNYGPITITPADPNFYDLDVYLNVGGIISMSGQYAEGQINLYVPGYEDPATIEVYLYTALVDYFPMDIRTACTRIKLSYDGKLGGVDEAVVGGYNMNFFDDCDTTQNTVATSNSSIYIYEGSPFVCRINEQGDTVLNSGIYSACWTDGDGFKPLGLGADSTTWPDYQYGYTNLMTTDEKINVEIEYFAPLNPDTCSFIAVIEKVRNNTYDILRDVFLGEFTDWDIPSDLAFFNSSGCDSSRNLIYCIGTDFFEDSIPNNDCVPADQRMGGIAYIAGFRGNGGIISQPRAMWSAANEDYVYETTGFEAIQMYDTMSQRIGYTIYEEGPTWADYEDLHLVSVFGQFNLYPYETITFIYIILSEYDGGAAGMQETVDKAVAWTAGHLPLGQCCFFDGGTEPTCDMLSYEDCRATGLMYSWDLDRDCGEPCECHCLPGDVDNSGNYNILDVTYLINYLYRGGPAPIPYELCSGDVSCNCGNHNILDVTSMINYLYKSGQRPCNCWEWIIKCGPPLR